MAMPAATMTDAAIMRPVAGVWLDPGVEYVYHGGAWRGGMYGKAERRPGRAGSLAEGSIIQGERGGNCWGSRWRQQ